MKAAQGLVAVGSGNGRSWAPQREEFTAGTGFDELDDVLQSPPPVRGSASLKRILVSIDALALFASWVPVLVSSDVTTRRALIGLHSRPLAAAVATVFSLMLVASQKLYRSRVCSVKAVELVRLWRVAVFSAVVAVAVDGAFGLSVNWRLAAARGALCFAALVVGRSSFRAWVNAQRRRGRYIRPVVVVGANDEGQALCHLVRDYPELGFRVAGVVGEAQGEDDLEGDLLGTVDHTLEAVQVVGATGVLIATTALSTSELNRLIRELLEARVHVQLSTGLRGIASERMSVTSIAYESLFYVEAVTLTGWQSRVKRCVDIILGFVLMLLALPIFLATSLAIKAEDRGSVFFRQVRIGRHGKPFTIYKLRTMVEDAEVHLTALGAHNERSGPLFKMTKDPRVTRAGRVLRATSIDELPQLLNVLRGQMSLVGPRPALPNEVAEFSPELLARQAVLPGITGLWQVQARDEAQFEAYHRLDLYYVENWSIILDLAIIFSTVQSIVVRAVKTLWKSDSQGPSAGSDSEHQRASSNAVAIEAPSA